MKLKEIEIEELYKFTRKHFVEHYDVQTELVDHLANDIEAIWKEKPKLSFEDAKKQSFKKFGVFGFMDVIESKQKALNKKYFKILWHFAREWFTVPKIVLTISIFLLSCATFQVHQGYIILLSLLFVLGLVDLVLAIKLKKKSKMRFANKNQKWMLEDMIFNTGSFSSFIIISNVFQVASFADNANSIWSQLLFSTFITIAIIYSYVSLVVIPEKAEELLEEAYLEYKIS
jgi:hypothetical protein